MVNEVLYKSIKSEDNIFINYYIIPENISADYCDLKCYGIKIEKITLYEGGGKIVESNQIHNVFYRYNDINEFLAWLVEYVTEPQKLRNSVEEYVAKSIDRARKSA